MITDENEALERVVKVVKEGTVTSITGKEIPLDINSICVHGDGEKALAFVKLIGDRLREENITVAALHTFI